MELLVPDSHPHGAFLQACVRDALQRLVLPSLEREIRRELTEKAEEHAVGVFVRNLRKLLLQPPVRGRRILAMDPGFRNGCKFAALDEFGNFLEGGVFHVLGGEEIRLQSRTLIADTIRRHSLSVIAIGNGTGCRECEQLVAEALSNELSGSGVVYVVVNEAGASVYSTSPIGREELPTHDPVMRGALSIGRRLLDPLSELVKINPANIGVGLYQHDVKGRHLRESLDAVVESCVNYVGVDVNTASPSLLRYVSGLNQLTARRLYEYRLEHGPFRSRSEFKDVPGLGEAAFVQAAGFLKIPHGDNPLDATWIHPESYGIASRVLEKLQGSVAELAGATGLAPKTGSESPGGASTSQKPSSTLNAVEGPGPFRDSFADRAAKLDLPAISRELQIGEMLLRDILVSLTRPGRDPRDDFPPPAFRTGILKLEDLKSGMELTGTVLNVVDFGAFVNIGISDCALVHISQLANRYVRDPHEVVSVGDVLTVWVLDVDKVRRRVSLTAIRPATEKKPSAPPSQPAAADAARAGKAPLARTSQRPDRDSRAKHPAKNRPQKGGSGPRAKPKPKPSKPITQAMVEGREPMRSFSDLAQFFEKKREPADDDKSENK
jgi:uncharacterized protein